ncbi:MAG: GNAT family N-acetyltransferase [Planctomycetota bacterium]
MAEVQLVRLDRAIEEALEQDQAFIDAMMQEDWPRVAEVTLQRLGRRPEGEPVSADAFGWGSAYALDSATGELVGMCAFKGEPREDGSVEIAYFTYHGFEGRGHATAMASRLIEIAFASPIVTCVVAHTLPHANASTRVLEKNGMAFAGEVTDPEDGQAWRWERPRATN